MSVESYRVSMGTCGWKHAAWHGDFYPDDLPEDWNLGFYSNEYPVVYVPANDWLDQPDLTDWLENVSAAFRFILEIPASCLKDGECFATALEKARQLGEHCLGLVFQLDKALLEDLHEFQEKLERAAKLAPVCVDKCGLPVAEEFQDILLSHDVSEVWHGLNANKLSSEANEDTNMTRGKLALARVSGEGLGGKDLRKVIENCLLAATDERVAVLCIDGDPPSLEVLRNADIILNLL